MVLEEGREWRSIAGVDVGTCPWSRTDFKMATIEEISMKKALVAIAGFSLAVGVASVAMAEDDAAYSVNAVGVVKYDIPADGELVCVSLPLNPLETSDAQQRWVWGETSLAQQLENGSDVYFWTGTGWRTYTKDIEDGTWPRSARTRVLEPGEAFFIRGANAQVISLLGELPTEDYLEYSLTGNDGLDVRGVTPYPITGAFGATSISTNLPNGSDVYFWTGTGWKTYTKDIEDGTWPRGARNYEYGIGEGIFIRARGNVNSVTNDRPFEWDN